MTALVAAGLSLLMIGTALLSGVFGMAGGLILVGVLVVIMPLPQAMVLHAVALLLLGCSPFIVRAIPDSVMPRTLGPSQMLGGSVVCMMLMLVTGVTGPLLDTLFLRSPLQRKEIIATKAACQLFSHALKLVYFGALIENSGSVEPWFLAIAVASSMIGTSLGKLLLEKLSDKQFR